MECAFKRFIRDRFASLFENVTQFLQLDHQGAFSQRSVHSVSLGNKPLWHYFHVLFTPSGFQVLKSFPFYWLLLELPIWEAVSDHEGMSAIPNSRNLLINSSKRLASLPKSGREKAHFRTHICKVGWSRIVLKGGGWCLNRRWTYVCCLETFLSSGMCVMEIFHAFELVGRSLVHCQLIRNFGNQ